MDTGTVETRKKTRKRKSKGQNRNDAKNDGGATETEIVEAWVRQEGRKRRKEYKLQAKQEEKIKKQAWSKKRARHKAMARIAGCRAAKEKNGTPFRVGAHNVQKLGATHSIWCQAAKQRRLFGLWGMRGWNIALISDVAYGGQGVREYKHGRRTWTIVHKGKVAIAMDESTARWWRRGGSKWQGSDDGLSLKVELPCAGWRPGRTVVAVYSPTSAAPAKKRRQFYQSLGDLLDKKARRSVLTIGGDWNAQVGASLDRKWNDVMGPHGGSRRSRTGQTLLNFCKENRLRVANSYTAQSDKATCGDP